MAVEITIFENDGQRFFLSGDAQNGKLKIKELHLDGLPTGNELLPLVSGEEFLIDKSLLEEVSPGKFQFKPFAGLTLTASLLIVSGKFFGRDFNVAGGISVQLIIRVPASPDDSENQSFFSVEACGFVSLNTAPVEFSTEPICFEVVLDKLNVSLPVLHIKLPDIGIELPRFRVPWPPKSPIPSFPFDLSPGSMSFPELPVKVSWENIRVEFDAAGKRLIIDVQQLRISGKAGAIEGDLHLVFQRGGIVLKDSSIRLTRPNIPKVDFVNWFFDENCLLVGWKEPQLTEWLRLLAPELADTAPAGDTEVALRLLRSRNGFREARLDWKKSGAQRVFNLPGFKVTFPAAEFYTLLVSSKDDQTYLTLYTTLAKDATAEAESTFSFGRLISGDVTSRELLNDETGGASPVKFTAKTSKAVSLALMRLPLNSETTPKFFHQAKQPLESLFALFPPDVEKCTPTDAAITAEPIGEGWTLGLNLVGSPFTFPFLKLGNKEQFIEVKHGSATKVDATFSCDLDIQAGFGTGRLTTKVTLIFRWDRFSFEIKDDAGITFTSPRPLDTTFLGMTFRFKPNNQGELFKLLTQSGDYRLQQAGDSEIEADFGAATSEESPITFKLRDFSITGAGVSVKGEVTDSPALLNGIQQEFRFKRGNFEINHNRLKGFSIFGSGPLPPDLVGDAIVDIALQFEVRNDKLELIAGDAKLGGTNLLRCRSTRFEFSIEGIGLKFVNDGGYHFYFTITGRAKFVPLPIDENEGPFSWLPNIELQLLDCPLTTDISVLAQHIKFVVELPEKKSFNFLGCFKMELRGIGFIPYTEFFDGAAAMQLTGQLMFADGADDVIEASIEFHSLYIGLPEPGSPFPRIHFKDLAVKVKKGDALLLEGVVDYLDEIEEGLPLRGFAGRGSMEIQGLPTLTVAFSFVRVKRAEDGALLRAWFLYVQASKFNVKLPLYDIRLREIGLGFGYRYTLISFKAIKGIDDPRKLIETLQELSKTQGELSRRGQWSIDPEQPGQSVPWTVVARALFAQTAATSQLFEWNESKEAELPCLFVMDVVLALKSDLTFLMTARAWLYTNYHDFLNNDSLREHPLVSGFALLQPKRKRLLAHFASNPGAEFGDHPPVPEYLKQAVNQSRFSATLLLEPGLLHYELGWPNMLRWKSKYGPLTAEFRGGVIFRLSRSEIVYGNSFLARGSLVLSGKAGNDTIGARLSATANVAFGARYIGVLGLRDPAGRSALYGGVGVEINVRVLVEFWLRLKFAFVKININLRLEFSLNFTASLEIGITAGKFVGVRGTASIGISIMGRDLHFSIRVGINESAVNDAFNITSQYLNIGFEAVEVEPIPGTQSRQIGAGSSPNSPIPNDDAGGAAPERFLRVAEDAAFIADTVEPTVAPPHVFVSPHYTIFVISVGEDRSFFVLFPNQNEVAGFNEEGFLPVPPRAGVNVVADFEWSKMAGPGENTLVEHFKPVAANPAEAWELLTGGKIAWKANWAHPMGSFQKKEMGSREADDVPLNLGHLLNQAFIPENINEITNFDLTQIKPEKDPRPPYERKQDSIEDPRVHNPSDEAFEAAVRGAAEQFAGAPHFKRDPNSIYEQHLNNAFSPTTSIYSVDGQTNPEKGEGAKVEDEEIMQHVLQLRGMMVGQIISDLQKYVALENRDDSSKVIEQAALIDKSVAFQMGLVFKTRRKDPTKPGGIPNWLFKLDKVGVLRQRNTTETDNVSAEERKVELFNTKIASFKESPPQFQRVQQYTDANTVAITWDLLWSNEIIKQFASNENKLSGDQLNPEHYLRHYHVRRISVSGGEREVEYEVKMGQCLNLPFVKGEMTIDGPNKLLTCTTAEFDKLFRANQRVKLSRSSKPENNRVLTIAKSEPTKLAFKEELVSAPPALLLIVSKELQPLRSRFQFVDHFNEETAEDQAALPANGKSYIYTITPVDVAGEVSSRPLTIVATRRPIEPPAVPADAQLIVRYEIKPDSFTPAKKPQPLKPSQNILVRWTDPAEAAEQFRVGVEEYRLLFRKETAFPVGSYGLDSDSHGNSAKRLPPSGARKLRTDVELKFPKPKPKPNEKKGLFEVELKLEEFSDIFPAGEWQPEAWQVFLQAKSTTGVDSPLAPVRIALQFSQGELKAERNPSRLEWVTRPLVLDVLPSEDERVAVGFAKVPMPTGEEKDTFGVWHSEAPLKVVSYHEHPERPRCLEFEWNQGPSANQEYPVELHAGYGLFEFDSDAHLWPLENLFDKMRRVQEMKLLPGDEAPINPATALIANQWEAWYPSTTRRLNLRESSRNQSQNSDSVLSEWYSWRDSYLVWPNDQSMQTRDGAAEVACVIADKMDFTASGIKLPAGGLNVFKKRQLVRVSGSANPSNTGIKTVKEVISDNEITFFEEFVPKTGECLLLEGLFGSATAGGQTLNLVAENFVVLGTSEIDFDKQTLSNQNGGFENFRPGQFVQLSGALDPELNGVKQIVKANSDKELQFAPKTFSKPKLPAGTVQKVDGRPFAMLHPFLAKLVAELDNDPEIIVDLNPPPVAEHGDLNLLLSQSTPKQDPYGWNILKRMGLSVAFFLRDEKTGDYFTPEKAQTRLASALQKIKPSDAEFEKSDIAKHLVVEFLFQSAKSIRLQDENQPANAKVESAAAKDLLALVQISLRPALQQLFKYTRYEIQLPRGAQTTEQSIEVTIRSVARSGYDLLEVSRNAPPVPVPFEPNNPERTFAFKTSARAPLVFLIRCAADVDVKGRIEGGNPIAVTATPVAPTDSLAARFGTANWGAMFAEDKGFFVNWHRARRYLLRANPPNPSSLAKFEVPTPGGGEPDGLNKLLGWLKRFFDHGGDHVKGSGGLFMTAPQIWCASAYPRPVSPIYLTPDQAGRLTYHHLIPDKWAHVYRYYFLPQGRYDALWKALADTFQPNGDEAQLDPSPKIDAQAGGLDVVLDRIQKLAAPMMLFSGRLDEERTNDTEVTKPGKIWEVIVAKHPEQRLVERNRTLVRQLDYRQMAHTLARRFAFVNELQNLDAAITAKDSSYKLIAEHLRFSEPPSLKPPENFDASEPDVDEAALALDLTRRTGAFGTEALIMRWDSLPYFYEHHLLLVAQSSRVASPVTEVTQREFEYHSPSPRAFAEGVKHNDVRKLLIRLPLNRYLDCTPEEVHLQWGLNEKIVEKKLTLAMLPDTGVIYQLVLEFGDLIETQAEIFFGQKKPEDPSGYYGRQLGSKLLMINAEQSIRIIPPKATGASFEEKQELERLIDQNFWLEILLEPKTAALMSNEQPVSSRLHFKPLTSGDSPEFPVPKSCQLVWDGEISAAEFAELEKFQQGKDWDNSFANAYARLLDALRDKQGEKALVTTLALIGLEQLTELSNEVTLPAVGPSIVTWKGTADERQVSALENWGLPRTDPKFKRSEYPEVFTRLLNQLKQKTIEASFVPDGGKIPTQAELPAELRDRLTTGINNFVWKRLDTSEVEARKLAELLADNNISAAFRTALKGNLKEARVEVEVKDYKPRPRNENLPAPLQAKLLIGNAVLSFKGWMTRAEARELMDQQKERVANQKSILRLFDDSVSSGLGGGLMVTARLGTATLVEGKITGNLE